MAQALEGTPVEPIPDVFIGNKPVVVRPAPAEAPADDAAQPPAAEGD